ncbi:DsbA family protein [Aliagarivorans taiwanensis]|uniref:DsbA family protein n=1 Tax=Aliagarivorans taiwanensis TaxID=561966 RepID=UPI00040278BF|nr:DsbA family protein [Aliagarivorans taiwanensis]
MSMPTLYYVHDPMCSWCWGFQPTWNRLLQLLPSSITVKRLVGGLAPDSYEPMPEEMRHYLQQTWRRIETELDRPFNHDFWRNNIPRRSTYPACRAVIAARAHDLETEMIEAIQQAYYLDARNPSDLQVLKSCASQIGISEKVFVEAMDSAELEYQLQTEIAQARSMPINGFPSLVIESEGQRLALPLDYHNEAVMLSVITSKLDPKFIE